MGVEINKIDFNIRSLLILFFLLTNTSFAQRFNKKINKTEINLAVPPSRIFKAIAYDFPNLGVIILPQVYKKIERIHGDGGAGTIILSYLQEGITLAGMNVERVETRDDKKLFQSSTMIKGPYPTCVEKLQIDMTFKATADKAGTIIKRKTYFYTTRNITVDESEIAAFNEQVVGLFKAFEAYLLANPDA